MPAPGPLLAALATAALIEAEPLPVLVDEGSVGTEPGGPGAGPRSTVYRVHPGVAAAIMATAGPSVRDAVDFELGAFWQAVFDHGLEREGGDDSGLVVRAGRAAAPYLCAVPTGAPSASCSSTSRTETGRRARCRRYRGLRRIAAATGAPADAGVLARVLGSVDPREAERLLRGAVEAADAAEDYLVASTAAGDLVNALQDAGRPVEALEAAGQKASYTQRAGIGRGPSLATRGNGCRC